MEEEMEFEGADEVYQDILKLINKQLREALEECRKSGNPLLKQCFIPADLRMSTYRLPWMDDKFNKFFDLDDDSEELLEKQLDWTPPGWASTYKNQLRAVANHGKLDCAFDTVSMALWGVHDRKHILRQLTSIVLEGHHSQLKNVFARGRQKMAARWFSPQPGKEEVNSEWENICQSLKQPSIEINWFVLHILSNILRRPVVMHGLELNVGQHKQEMRGIFLPSMIDPTYCYKTPIVVGYADSGEPTKAGHLTALVGYDGELSYVSLVDDNGKRLPVWYGVEDEREGHPCPETALLQKYMELIWHKAPDGKEYPLAKMGVTKMNVGNDAVIQTANRVRSLFEKEKEEEKMAETAEQAGSGVCADDVRPKEAKRKRDVDGPDEVELSRRSKRTLPSSPSSSFDAAVNHGPDSALPVAPASPLAADVLSMPSPSARASPRQRPFAGEQGTPNAWPPRGQGRLATACLAAVAATTILIIRAKW